MFHVLLHPDKKKIYIYIRTTVLVLYFLSLIFSFHYSEQQGAEEGVMVETDKTDCVDRLCLTCSKADNE